MAHRKSPGSLQPQDSIDAVVGGKTAKALTASFGIKTVADLLSHYPRRYLETGEKSDLSALIPGDHVTVFATIESTTMRRMKERKGTIVEVVVTDGTGQLSLVFFSQAWREKQCQVGRRGLFEGTVGMYGRKRQLTHPRLLLLPDGVIDPDHDEAARFFTRRMVPIYPASQSVSSWRIAQAVTLVLDALGEVEDPLPEDIRTDQGIIGLRQAWEQIHRPMSEKETQQAVHRLRFDEAFGLQLVLAQRRREWSGFAARARSSMSGGILEQFDAKNPFELTGAQLRVGEEIAADLAAPHPMHRLLQGDVGSGKTLVALRAMLAVVAAGGQAALLAPTEVLAHQHWATILRLLGPLAETGMLGGVAGGTQVALLTGSMGARARREMLEKVSSGSAGIVVGTHALLQESVSFADLGLVVVDEQHRFGVEQRAALAKPLADGTRPHVLVMTATPIPRTVAMTVFGDLDVSVLDELPMGRQAIATHVVPVREKPTYLSRAWQRIEEEVAQGRKAYVVCPRIGDLSSSDSSQGQAMDEEFGDDDDTVDGERSTPAASVIDVAAKLQESLLPHLRIGVMHGRLPAEEKDDVMRRFAAPMQDPDALDVLVSTTVIEVGVDVPAATVMVILDADRFGVSQIHQLRGRVGRGSDASLCLLVTGLPSGAPARDRLDAVASTSDGFALARMDLHTRREGDVLGTEQSGNRSSLRLLEVVRDEQVVADARVAAERVIEADPDLSDHRVLWHVVDRLTHDRRSEFLEKG
jgi:ATP-dependent DNA helicase RecG